jgi:hypothetical protein
MMVSVGFDRDLYESVGIIRKIYINLLVRAMLLIVGATGMGKTWATRYVLANNVKCDPMAKITIIDIKNYDFAPDFKDCPRCYGTDTALEGIKNFHEEFNERVKAGRVSDTMPRRVLLIDEYAALASMSAYDKSVKEIMAIISKILMTGRAYSQTVIIGCQRAQSELFPSGSRDNFGNIIHMGNFSKEQRLMVASDFSDEIVNDCGRGQGYLLQQGKPISRILIPGYEVDRANELIRGALQEWGK